jgi:hypothetical protein
MCFVRPRLTDKLRWFGDAFGEGWAKVPGGWFDQTAG